MKPKLNVDTGYGELMGLWDQYAAFVSSSGRRIFRSNHDETLNLISSLSEDRKSRLINRLKDDVSILSAAAAAKEDLGNSKQLLWRYFQKSKLTPCSDLFDQIAADDVIEIYSTDQVHMWQNLNFFNWCSITLETLYTEAWYNFSKRDIEYSKQLALLGAKIFSGEFKTTIPSRVPWHLVEEVNTEMMLKFELEIKVMSPVFQNGSIAGIVLVNRCRKL